jgi:adenylate cyclase
MKISLPKLPQFQLNPKKILISPWTALITLVLILSIRIADPVFVESIRLRYFDTLITSQTPTQNNIITINIDENALDKYGQWPFKRDVYAQLIDELYKRNAGLVVFNVLMTEKDRQGGDARLATTLSDFPVILPNMPADRMKNTPRQPGTAVIGSDFQESIIQYPGIIANISELEKRAAGVGIVNTLPEVDGVNRRMPLVVSVDGRVYPSLAMEALRVAAGDTTVQVKLFEGGVEKMRIPKFGPITTDQLGRVWIDWSQQSKSYSMTELPKDFGGAVVIVGVAAAGLGNPVPTAVGSVWPHDVQAAVLGTMFNGVVIQRPDYADGVEILTLALAGILLIFLTRYVYVGLATTIGLVVISGIGSWFVFNNFLWLFDATAPGVGLVLVALHAYGVKFVSEFLQKQQIKKQFGSYVSPVIVERLQKDPSLIRLGGEEKMLTAVMTDMRNFTGLGEKYGADVEGFTAIMNSYMTAISKPVFANDGCLIKFIGDASLHIHGAPVDDDRHAYHGVKTALEMIEAVNEFNKHLESIGKPPVGMGAGVNTGKILVGNIGSEGKMGYDVLGDPVSVASRLEGQTKGYGVLIIIGPDTYEEVKNDFTCLELDCIAVKGKAIGLNIYTPITTKAESNDLQMHAAMLQLYRQQKFDQAIKFCKDLMGRFEGSMDHYYEIWIERCEEMKTHDLPADWDGVFRATSK